MLHADSASNRLTGQVIYMMLFGYLVFGDLPSLNVWLGAAIVVASGLYLFARERRRLAQVPE